MPIGSVSELRRVGAVDLARVAGFWLAAYVGLTLCAALIPHPDIPNGFVLTALFAGLSLALLLRLLAAPLVADTVALLNCLFVAIGIAYMALSAAEMLPNGNLRPTRQDLILRHSYFILIWIPLIAGASAFFDLTISTLARIARRAALPFLVSIIVADMVTARWLGDPDNSWEGYVSFLNPAATTFLYVGSFFLHVATTRRSKIALLLVTGHAALSYATDYGVMFNTFTGTFSLGCMWAFAIGAYRSPRLALFGVMAVGGALMCILALGVVFPGLAAADLNTHWRFLVWRENLFTFFESSFLGVGFGTPYYSLTAGNIETAYMFAKTPEFAHHVSPIDVLYYRAQHSSFVNAFYRMGVAGGALLVAISVASLAMVWKAARPKDSIDAWLAAAGGALFVIEASQVAMHVGLESPRYFCFFALAIGFARAAAHRTARSWNG